MRILVVAFRDIKNPEAAGASIYLHRVFSRLAEKGHAVTILSSNFASNSRKELIGPLKVVRSGSSLTYSFRAPFLYLKKFRGHFDIIVEEFGSGWLPFFASLYVSEPIVVLAYQRQREVFFKELPMPLAFLCSWLEAAFILFNNLIGTRFIAISESTKDDLVSMGVLGTNVAVCTPGQRKSYVILKNFEENIKNKEDAFMILSRARPYKGIHYAILAMKLVVKELPHSKLFLILGKGHKGYERRLQQQITNMGLSKNVFLFFNCGEKFKIDLLLKSKVLLNPSLKEGFGMIVTEANAFGLPAIAFNVSGSRDVISNGLNGILVPPKDFRAMSKAMIELLSNEELYLRLARGAQKWSKNFDWETTVTKFESFLCSHLATK